MAGYFMNWKGYESNWWPNLSQHLPSRSEKYHEIPDTIVSVLAEIQAYHILTSEELLLQ
jgi:hypothetical protein